MSTVYHVLFLCKHNASRSLMAEAILNNVGQGRFLAYSAGTEPSKVAHPYMLEVLREEGFDTTNLRPKSIQNFLDSHAPKMNLVIGLCNSLQQDETLDIQMANHFPMIAHWHINDSESISGDNEAQKAAFSQVMRQLSQRIHLFANLPNDKVRHLTQLKTVEM